MKGTGHLSCLPFPRYLIDEVIVRPNPAAETDLCQGVGTETVICLWLETFREGPTPGVVACLTCVCVRAPACSVPQLWLTLCDPLDRSHRPPCPWNFPGKNTGAAATPSCRGSFPPRGGTCISGVSCTSRQTAHHCTPGKSQASLVVDINTVSSRSLQPAASPSHLRAGAEDPLC